MKSNELRNFLRSEECTTVFTELYGKSSKEKQQIRYSKLITMFESLFQDSDLHLFSTSGRTELGGNHTDHNNGKVFAGGIQLDAVAVAAKNDNNTINLFSVGYDQLFSIDLTQLSPITTEKETTNALLRGVAAGFQQNDYSIGGFNAVVQSSVLQGSGLSSSAAFEVLVGTILNSFYNEGKVDEVEIAKIGQYAENEFFGKPCGLMDQTACACGFLTEIDFESTESPVIEKVAFSFTEHGYQLLVVDTGGSHADLTDDYASIPREMKKVATYFNRESCRGLTYKDLISNATPIRERAGDRALLRAMHFVRENDRVEQMVNALRENNLNKYFSLINESGRSSFQYLQNIYSPKAPEEQGVSLALSMTDHFLGNDGAFRIQGGGFAGTIQAYIPLSRIDEYIDYMENLFSKGSVTPITIRQSGTAMIA